MFFSVTLLYQGLVKVLYNICSKKKIMMDKWTLMDTISAIFNITAI